VLGGEGSFGAIEEALDPGHDDVDLGGEELGEYR
jgi:hypothetical protein